MAFLCVTTHAQALVELSQFERESPGCSLAADALHFLTAKIGDAQWLFDSLVSVLADAIRPAVSSFDDRQVGGRGSALAS